jgi:hypothetical protein
MSAAKRFVSLGKTTLLPLRALRFIGAGKRNGLGLDSASSREAPPKGAPRRSDGIPCERSRIRKPLPRRRSGPAFEATSLRLKRISGATQSREKLRESAARRLKSLARATSCAPPSCVHCSKLALGPASASARPTSSPRSSIEVCSRIERSSPFAWRSACSGERATLTVTFDSTSGCR